MWNTTQLKQENASGSETSDHPVKASNMDGSPEEHTLPNKAPVLNFLLAYKSPSLECSFWRSLASSTFYKVDLLNWLACLVHNAGAGRKQIWPNFQFWARTLLISASLHIVVMGASFGFYMKHRQKMILIQRVLRLVALWDMARRLDLPGLHAGIKAHYSHISRQRALVKVMLLMTGSGHHLLHAVAMQVSFRLAVVTQLVALCQTLYYCTPILVQLFELPEYMETASRTCKGVEALLSHMLSALNGSSMYLPLEFCQEYGLGVLVILLQILLGFCVPLYVLYCLELSWKMRHVAAQQGTAGRPPAHFWLARVQMAITQVLSHTWSLAVMTLGTYMLLQLSLDLTGGQLLHWFCRSCRHTTGRDNVGDI